MKKKIFKTLFVVGISVFLLNIMSGFSFFEKKPWPVPDKDKNLTNPIKSDPASISAGKALWAKHCQSCHGKSGMGDGSKAPQLKTEPGDFSKTETQSQTNGSLFYKTAQGRDDMPGFKKKIPDADDIWSVVNYIRTFKK